MQITNLEATYLLVYLHLNEPSLTCDLWVYKLRTHFSIEIEGNLGFVEVEFRSSRNIT